MPKVSVIIPVYNTEKYLRQCLDSVINQTLQDIEIICVDDGSTDASGEILSQYEAMDSRIRGVVFEQSQSALEARRIGVQMAVGEYILFLDSDDYLELDACNALYREIVKRKVDILQFSSIIENCANLPESRIRMNQRLLEPLNRKLKGKEIFSECFTQKKYGFTLWNKLIRTQLCKDAFSKMRKEYMPKAQDMYTYFAISSLTESYYGWKSKPYHHYCFGRGVTASAGMSLNKFKRYCMQAKVVAALENFCREQNIDNEETKNVIEQFQAQWIKECVCSWYDLAASQEDAFLATKELFDWWSPQMVIPRLAEQYWYSGDVVSTRIGKSLGLDLANKRVRTIGIYYYHFTIGGVQRVLSLLIPILQDIGYRVVLVTDKEPDENDFLLVDGVPRVLVQDHQKTNRDNYSERLHSWKRVLGEYNIDLVLYNAWTSPLLLWDMLYLKSQQVPVIVQTHSIFSYDLFHLGKEFGARPKMLALADGIVTLTETDRLFWSAYNHRVWKVPNPVAPQLKEALKTDGNTPIITWIGRFSNEKQPWEAIYIMQTVIQMCPNAMLYMIGDGTNSGLLKKYEKIAEEKGVAQNVKFLGYQSNVSQYLQKAAVNLITSTYEGYSMVLVEAQAHGVPTVMYRLPYLELCREERGVTGIAPGDRVGAAREIINLVQQRNLWEKQHKKAIQSFSDLAQYDYENAWEKVISGECVDSDLGDREKELVRTIVEHYLSGWKRVNRPGIQASSGVSGKGLFFWLHCFIRFIVLLPSKFKGGVRCYQEHGWDYTWQRLMVHLKVR